MRSALICVFFTLIVQKEGSRAEDDDFRPTPIPLSNWSGEKQEPAGTLQEYIKTDTPPTVAVLPAHYWEDALRHSVYLTLVRDKIDQLIAKGDVISPDSKPDNLSKEVDDHDLWEKIKTAPFDRVKEGPLPPGDVIILAKGRLLEDKDGYRFAEDDAFPDKCNKDNCTLAVKAYWSVKRVRQGESAPGKYHYELTFSVTSQVPKKVKKPYENPVRTFTIRENTPIERAPPQRAHQHPQSNRAQRAVWIHKNIYQKRPSNTLGLDRIFSSLFSDDDNYDDMPYRRKPNAYIPQAHAHVKLGYTNDRDPYHQQLPPPYQAKPLPHRYTRPPLQQPPMYYQNPYTGVDQGGFNQYNPTQQNNMYISPNPIKTTKPAVLPTPVTNFQIQKESSVDAPIRTTLNASEYTTREPEIITNAYKLFSYKPPPPKVTSFPENIRPPIYNAPPGVFATMDKKPFKPLPPFKLGHSHKPYKSMPSDFRPSPQILDSTYADSDSSADTAFRPITLNLTEFLNSKKGPKGHRKQTTAKKPAKKHDNIKPYRLTTVSPDIITIRTDTGIGDELDWAEILGAFTKTTPMASYIQTEKFTDIDFSTSSTVPPTTTTTENQEEETTTKSTTTSTSSTTTTTSKPKRTRPPPKFTKQDKVKKHKRITTTSTTSTTSTTTTAKPSRKHLVKKSSDDLIPQASSAATNSANSVRETKKNENFTSTSTSTTTTTPTTTTGTTPTTSRTTTTKVPTTSSTTRTTTDSEPSVATEQPKSINRFRMSTLMQKGTSVKHDKWSAATFEKNKTNSAPTNKYLLRRKASKFQGYIPSSTPRLQDKERNREDHEDHAFSSNKEVSSTMTHPNEDAQEKTQRSAQNEETPEWKIEEEKGIEIETEEDNETDGKISNDDKEYIFPEAANMTEKEQNSFTTDQTVVASPHSNEKNQTKCKKKKHTNLTSTEYSSAFSEIDTTTVSIPTTTVTTTSTDKTTVSDIFSDLFGGFTMDDITEKPKTTRSTVASEPSQSESENHEEYIPIDTDFEDFLHSLDHKNNHGDKTDDDYDDDNDDADDNDDDDEGDEDSPFNNGLERDSRHLQEDYYDDSQGSVEQETQGRPFSLLELMAME